MGIFLVDFNLEPCVKKSTSELCLHTHGEGHALSSVIRLEGHFLTKYHSMSGDRDPLEPNKVRPALAACKPVLVCARVSKTDVFLDTSAVQIWRSEGRTTAGAAENACFPNQAQRQDGDEHESQCYSVDADQSCVETWTCVAILNNATTLTAIRLMIIIAQGPSPFVCVHGSNRCSHEVAQL